MFQENGMGGSRQLPKLNWFAGMDVVCKDGDRGGYDWSSEIGQTIAPRDEQTSE